MSIIDVAHRPINSGLKAARAGKGAVEPSIFSRGSRTFCLLEGKCLVFSRCQQFKIIIGKTTVLEQVQYKKVIRFYYQNIKTWLYCSLKSK